MRDHLIIIVIFYNINSGGISSDTEGASEKLMSWPIRPRQNEMLCGQ